MTAVDYPVEIASTDRFTYWRLQDGTVASTKPSTILPPPVFSGGYPTLDTAKRQNGDA